VRTGRETLRTKVLDYEQRTRNRRLGSGNATNAVVGLGQMLVVKRAITLHHPRMYRSPILTLVTT